MFVCESCDMIQNRLHAACICMCYCSLPFLCKNRRVQKQLLLLNPGFFSAFFLFFIVMLIKKWQTDSELQMSACANTYDRNIAASANMLYFTFKQQGFTMSELNNMSWAVTFDNILRFSVSKLEVAGCTGAHQELFQVGHCCGFV